MKIDLGNGKYHLTFDEKTGKLEACRYGEAWRDLTGDNLILALMQRITDLEKLLEHMT